MELSNRFSDAFTYAFEIHKEPRKGTQIPYISHLIGVAAIVLEQGGTEDEAIAAILHDAVEDKGGKERLEDIRSKFGERVATIVDGCTDAYTDPKPLWRPRKERYIAHLPESDPSVRLVSAADKLHNARLILEHYRDVGDKLWDRFKGGKEGTLWYYRTLVETFKKTGPNKLASELDRVVSELEQLASSMEPTVLFKPAFAQGGFPVRLTEAGVEGWDGSAWVPSKLLPADVVEGVVMSPERAARLGIPSSDLADGEMEPDRAMLSEVGKDSRPS